MGPRHHSAHAAASAPEARTRRRNGNGLPLSRRDSSLLRRHGYASASQPPRLHVSLDVLLIVLSGKTLINCCYPRRGLHCSVWDTVPGPC